MGSLSGQWTSAYTGSSTGCLVIDVDRLTDHYEGIAIAWDDNPNIPSIMVNITMSSNESKQEFPQHSFSFVTREGVSSQPSLGNLNLELNDNGLSFIWSDNTAGDRYITSLAPRTLAGERSFLKPKNVSWPEFKALIPSDEPQRFVYRGHADGYSRLRTSFHRTGRSNIDRFRQVDVNQLFKVVTSISSRNFELDNPQHYLAFLSLVQHHGYPTPLLDWTFSPYVAAYFAFYKHPKGLSQSSDEKIRIYKFDSRRWNEKHRIEQVFPNRPSLGMLDALAFDNSRVIPQQALSMFSNVDDIETHISFAESNDGVNYLEVFDLHLSERDAVIRELDLMGVTSASLFPGLDGACVTLKERYF